MNKETQDRTTENWMKEAQKGYIRIGILMLLNNKPSHGYELMKEINNRTKGFWQPTPGGVYPILRDLEKSSYIKGQWQTQKNRRLKVYRITKSGEAILKRAIVKQAKIFDNITGLFTEFAREVLNVEPSASMPNMPSPFTPFLEEKKDPKENFQQLERQRMHLLESIKSMKERLNQINIKIAEAKKETKLTSATDQKPTDNLNA